MDSLLEMLPNQAVKIGYLLDLGRSSFADRYQTLILQELIKLIESISLIRDILPAGSTDDDIVKAINDVRSRIGDDVLGREIGDLLSKKLDGFMNDKEGSEPRLQTQMSKPAAAPKKKASNKRTHHSGEVIFKEGDIGDEAFMILSGEVEISIKTGNGSVTLAKLGRGEIFGEMALIDDQPRMATATSLAETTLSAVPEEAFKKRLTWLSEEDRIISRILESFVTRLRQQGNHL